MKQIKNKLWSWYFKNVMGVKFIADKPEFQVTKPIGVLMCEREVLFGALYKVSDGFYSFSQI